MMIAMFAGMALGMVVGEVFSVSGLMWLFGDAEIMLSTMTTGMIAGMVVSMSRAMQPMPGHMMSNTLSDHLLISAAVGLSVIVAIWFLTFVLSGERKIVSSPQSELSNGR